MQPVRNAEKHANDATRGKTCNQCQAQESTQLVPSEGKHATSAKRLETNKQFRAREKKTRNWCEARKNMPLVPSAGQSRSQNPRAFSVSRSRVLGTRLSAEMSSNQLHATNSKRRKHGIPSAGKHVTDAKHATAVSYRG